ncbi:MAG: hypothetical protein ACK5H2_11210 [Beutenbergiaceae bacterium]
MNSRQANADFPSERRIGRSVRDDRRRGAQGNGRVPRPERDDRVAGPPIPEDVDWQELDRAVRARLRTLSKANAERVGQHLVMAGRLLDDDPQLAYEHAQAAVRRAGRVDVVREAAALAAYATGRYSEALRELRTVRRLSGVDAHRAIEADCERGLGRPDRALSVIATAGTKLPAAERVELAIVESGARLDLGEPEAALAVLERVQQSPGDGDGATRLANARHDVLIVLGRVEPEPNAASMSNQVGAEAPSSDGSDSDILEIADLSEPT